MHTKLVSIALCALMLPLLSAPAHAAPADTFGGSRGDVRHFCVAEGSYLLEGGNFSQCITATLDIICRSDDVCWSSNIELARAAGFQRTKAAGTTDL